MIATLITKNNRQQFLQAVPRTLLKNCDVFLGAIDEDEDVACGVLAAEALPDHSLAIRFIYVAEEYRRMGAGTVMIEALKDVAYEIEATGLICLHEAGNESDGIDELLTETLFYSNPDDSSFIYSVSLDQLEAGREMKHMMCFALSDISDKRWKSVGDKWRKLKGDPSVLHAFEDDRKDYDQDYSFIYIDKSETSMGLLLVYENAGNYEIDTFQTAGKNADVAGLTLINNAVDRAKKNLPGDTRIIAEAAGEKVEKLLNGLSGGAMVCVGKTTLYYFDIEL
ncbi:MAG: GNAT family N-acetyltransferase [Lachnospiraceae bacterium]|nr:GNAT family N-acetyltransferase [Lachnospiraceae bacterium]